MTGFLKDEKGDVNIIIAVSMTVLMIMTAFVIDIGAAYLNTSKAQNVADATVFSIGQMLPIKQNDTQAISAIKQKAIEYAAKNSITNLSEQNIQLSELKNNLYYSVKVTIEITQKTKIASTIGINEIKVAKSAKTVAYPVGGVTGAVPLGIKEADFKAVMDTGNLKHHTLKYGGGDGDNGFYGFIGFDGSNSASVMQGYFKYGYDKEIRVNEIFPAASGNMASAAKKGFDYRYSSCTHYLGQGGCNAERYVESCPRIMLCVIYKLVNYGDIKVIGFAPFIIENASGKDEIVGSYVKLNLPPSQTIAQTDCGSYYTRLVE